jgi:hypothetical protein
MDTIAITTRLGGVIGLSQSIVDRIHQDAAVRKESLLDIWQVLRSLLESQTGLDQGV